MQFIHAWGLTNYIMLAIAAASIVGMCAVVVQTRLSRAESEFVAQIARFVRILSARSAELQSERSEPQAWTSARFDAAAGEQWVDEATKAALRIVDEKGEVTADDVWAECPPPENVDGRLLASVFTRSDWEIVGYRASARGRNKARQIAVWRPKAREAAE